MKTSQLRSLLVLGRVSNLPTVWSNCLAAWWLGGCGCPHKFPFLIAGASLLYIGGMFLNDAFDASFDRQYRVERPIPSGAINETTVWKWGFALLAVGNVGLFLVATRTGIFGLVLVALILLYDGVHKHISFAPALMAACRFVLYLVAASSGFNGVPGFAVWCGLALACYIVGLSYIARRESAPGALQYWPLLFLAIPSTFALGMNAGEYRSDALILAAIVAVWILKSLRYIFWAPEPNLGRSVSSLLAGIVLVDWVAVADGPRELGLTFVGLFLLALFFQRFIPAT